jgi:hypothetical protein
LCCCTSACRRVHAWSCPSLGRWAGCLAGWLSVSRAWKLVKKMKPVFEVLRQCCCSARICRRHEQQVIDLVSPVATHPFFHFHMFWCSSEAIRPASDPALFPVPPPSASELAAANHWVLVLQTTALESLCATTVPDSSTRLKNTAQGSLSSLSSLCIRRWLAVCWSSRSPTHAGLANPQEPLHAG